MNDSSKLSRMALESGAIRLSPEKPFTWASGYKMPIYNDNRLLLGKAEYRSFIAQIFAKYSEASVDNVDVIAGTATAGIPHATTLADRLSKPLIYVRATTKSHGMGNQIEGPLVPGQKVLLIEDLISTGGSAINAVNAIREGRAVSSSIASVFLVMGSSKLVNDSMKSTANTTPFSPSQICLRKQSPCKCCQTIKSSLYASGIRNPLNGQKIRVFRDKLDQVPTRYLYA